MNSFPTDQMTNRRWQQTPQGMRRDEAFARTTRNFAFRIRQEFGKHAVAVPFARNISTHIGERSRKKTGGRRHMTAQIRIAEGP